MAITDELFDTIIHEYLNTRSIVAATNLVGISSVDFFRSLNKFPSRQEAYELAQKHLAEINVDELMSRVRDENHSVPHVKNFLDAVKWTASKHNRAKYGEQLQVDHNMKLVDVREALSQRDLTAQNYYLTNNIRPGADSNNIIEAQLVESIENESADDTGLKPVPFGNADDIFS